MRSHPTVHTIVNATFPPTEGTTWVDGILQLRGGRILDAVSGANPDVTGPSDGQLDASGCTVLPGFIDVHIHGCDGHDTMDATPQALQAMARFLVRHGVTAFLPTTITASHNATLAAVRNVAAVAQEPAGARILAIHLEGPYISPEYPGAQPQAFVREPDVAEFEELVAAGPVGLITLAPERPGADKLIQAALRHDVAVVIGHTAASFSEAEGAIQLGASQATHTFNAMTGLHHRRPGVVGAVLSNDAIYAQLIPDTIHVHPAAMKILARCKGPARTILITDAIRASGLPAGQYDLGGQTVTVKEGQCRLGDGTLAGSIVTMDRAFAHFMAASDWPLARAWPVTSRTPATALGLAQEFGAVAPGYWADLVLLDGAVNVVATLVGGRLAYLRDAERLT